MGIGDVNEYTLKGMKKVDYADEHAYKAAGWAMTHFDHFDKYQRGAWDLYVGEYATNGGVAAGNMEASLSDAIYIMGMEKNGDLVKMSSYAPLLVNTNDVDWPVNLINFDASASFARISYYAIQMMNENRADRNLATELTVTPPAEKKPAFSGGIGLATWDTKTAYKDIEVIENGQTVYKSDFTRTPRDWNLLRGQWDLQDSALIQSGEGAQRFAMLKDRRFTGSYTLKMKAKKIGGYNAFIIPFAVKDENTFYRAHIGAWVNKVSVFEKVTNGFDVGNISSTTPLADTIVTNRWYDITLEVGIDTVKCYLNGKLLMSYTEPNKLFAIAGRKNDNGDLIIKLVNGYADPMPLTLDLRGISISAGGVAAPATTDSIAGELITLSAPQLSDENSYEHPLQYTPVHTTFPPADIHTPITLQPYSINIIRLHANSMPAKK
jgi:alpha-L-arabinofuranosidase